MLRVRVVPQEPVAYPVCGLVKVVIIIVNIKLRPVKLGLALTEETVGSVAGASTMRCDINYPC